MKNKKVLSIIALLTLLLVTLTACSGGGNGGEGSDGAKDGEIVIAHAGPMTGDSAQFGDMKEKAIVSPIPSMLIKSPTVNLTSL